MTITELGALGELRRCWRLAWLGSRARGDAG